MYYFRNHSWEKTSRPFLALAQLTDNRTRKRMMSGDFRLMIENHHLTWRFCFAWDAYVYYFASSVFVEKASVRISKQSVVRQVLSKNTSKNPEIASHAYPIFGTIVHDSSVTTGIHSPVCCFVFSLSTITQMASLVLS